MIVKFNYILSFILMGAVHFSNTEDQYCYMEDSDPYMFFSSRTAYERVRAQNMETLSECNAVYMWAVIRHGTRYMTNQDDTVNKITALKDRIVENHETHKRGELCAKDLENLKKWTFRWSKEVNGELAPQGKTDMVSLSKRLKKDFSSLLSAEKGKFVLQTSSKSRCKNSALEFTNELFGTQFNQIESAQIIVNDTLLRGFDTDNSQLVTKEYISFITSKYVQDVITEVSIRLGFEPHLSYDEVRLMYAFCSFENAWDLKQKSSFCVAFTPKHLKVLEFDNDLEYYYLFGHGKAKNTEIPSTMVEDLLNKLNDARKNKLSHVAAIYFAHSQTILSFITKFDIYYDTTPLTVNNYESLKETRKWRTSFIDPFAANIIFVLYKCGTKHKIAMYLHEHLGAVVPFEILTTLNKDELPKSVKQPETPASASGSRIVSSVISIIFVYVLQISRFFNSK